MPILLYSRFTSQVGTQSSRLFRSRKKCHKTNRKEKISFLSHHKTGNETCSRKWGFIPYFSDRFPLKSEKLRASVSKKAGFIPLFRAHFGRKLFKYKLGVSDFIGSSNTELFDPLLEQT